MRKKWAVVEMPGGWWGTVQFTIDGTTVDNFKVAGVFPDRETAESFGRVWAGTTNMLVPGDPGYPHGEKEREPVAG